MSNFITKHNIKNKGEIEIYNLDDCFGHHKYGVALRGDEKLWNTKDLPKFESLIALFKFYGYEEVNPKTKKEQLKDFLNKIANDDMQYSRRDIIDFVESLYNS